jgi:hypothetical protein
LPSLDDAVKAAEAVTREQRRAGNCVRSLHTGQRLVEVDELQGVVAILLDGRDGEDQQFRAEVCPDKGVRGVGVRSLDGRIGQRLHPAVLDSIFQFALH